MPDLANHFICNIWKATEKGVGRGRYETGITALAYLLLFITVSSSTALSVFLSVPRPLHYPLLAASQGHFPLAGNRPARTKWTHGQFKWLEAVSNILESPVFEKSEVNCVLLVPTQRSRKHTRFIEERVKVGDDIMLRKSQYEDHKDISRFQESCIS